MYESVLSKTLLASLDWVKMVILIDERDRENEGDLVWLPFVTPEALKFMLPTDVD